MFHHCWNSMNCFTKLGLDTSRCFLYEKAKADNIPAGPVSYRMVKKMHYKNGVYTDGRSKRIIEEVEGMIARAKEPLPGTTQPRRVTAELENAFYAEVVKLDSRGRLFGHGCISQGLREISSSGVASRAEAPVSDPRVTILENRFDRLEKLLVPQINLLQSTLEEHMQRSRDS